MTIAHRNEGHCPGDFLSWARAVCILREMYYYYMCYFCFLFNWFSYPKLLMVRPNILKAKMWNLWTMLLPAGWLSHHQTNSIKQNIMCYSLMQNILVRYTLKKL